MTSGHELAMALRAAYWAMHRQTDAVLSRRGVTADQFVLMSLLADQGGITQQDLVRRASSDANTVRAMLVLLEDRGMVVRKPHPTDGRARSVALTVNGRQIYEQLRAESEPLRRRLLSAMAPGDATTVVESLQRIAEALTPMPRSNNTRRDVLSAGR